MVLLGKLAHTVIPALTAALVVSASSASISLAASTRAHVERSQTVSTTSWAAMITSLDQISNTSPYLLRWAVSGGAAHDFFLLRNIGSSVLQGVQVDITQTRVSGNSPPSQIIFEWCVGGAWNATTNICSGSIQLLGSASDLKLHLANITLVVGSALSIRASTSISNRNSFRTTLSSLVTRGHIGSAMTSHS